MRTERVRRTTSTCSDCRQKEVTQTQTHFCRCWNEFSPERKWSNVTGNRALRGRLNGNEGRLRYAKARLRLKAWQQGSLFSQVIMRFKLITNCNIDVDLQNWRNFDYTTLVFFLGIKLNCNHPSLLENTKSHGRCNRALSFNIGSEV